MNSSIATVHATINASKAEAFEHIVPIDLASIFTGYGPLPSVAGTHSETGPWDAVGRHRTVVFSDGSSAHESLTGYDYPNHFAYRINGFTGVLRYLASEARGEWRFESTPSGTSITWSYEFVSRFKWLRPAVSLFAQRLWRGYMERALSLSKSQVERLGSQVAADVPGTAAYGARSHAVSAA